MKRIPTICHIILIFVIISILVFEGSVTAANEPIKTGNHQKTSVKADASLIWNNMTESMMALTTAHSASETKFSVKCDIFMPLMLSYL